MPRPPLGHLVALLGVAFAAAGAFGPWAIGVHVEKPVMAPSEAHPYERSGVENGVGWLIAAPAMAAALLLLLPLPTKARGLGAVALLGAALLVTLLAALDPADFPGWRIRIFERLDATPGWGLGLAAAGCVLALAGVLRELLAEDAQPS